MEKATSRLRVLALLVVVMFLALSARLWFLQVLAAQGFNKEAKAQSIRTVSTDPLRGQILDATSTPDHPVVLVGNQESREVRITPSELGDQGEAVVLRVSRITGVPVKEIAQTLRDPKYLPTQAIPVAEFVSKNVKFDIAEHPADFPGVSVESTFVRSTRSVRSPRTSSATPGSSTPPSTTSGRSSATARTTPSASRGSSCRTSSTSAASRVPRGCS